MGLYGTITIRVDARERFSFLSVVAVSIVASSVSPSCAGVPGEEPIVMAGLGSSVGGSAIAKEEEACDCNCDCNCDCELDASSGGALSSSDMVRFVFLYSFARPYVLPSSWVCFMKCIEFLFVRQIMGFFLRCAPCDATTWNTTELLLRLPWASK